MQFVVGAEELQVEGALVLGDAAKSLAARELHGDSAVRRHTAPSAAAPSAAGSGRHGAGIAQSLFDRRRRSLASDTGQIGAQDAAPAPDHVATGAVALAV